MRIEECKIGQMVVRNSYLRGGFPEVGTIGTIVKLWRECILVKFDARESVDIPECFDPVLSNVDFITNFELTFDDLMGG